MSAFAAPSSIVSIVTRWIAWLLDDEDGTSTQETLAESTLRIGMPL